MIARECKIDDCSRDFYANELCEYHYQCEYRAEVKLQCLTAYGGPFCCRCGVEDVSALGLHHRDGGGNAHRRLIGLPPRCSGHAFYCRLRELGWPEVPKLLVVCKPCHLVLDRELRARNKSQLTFPFALALDGGPWT